MEAAAGRGAPLPAPSPPPHPPPRKEWRAVSDHSFQTNGAAELEHVKLSQSDERTIYEEGAGPLDVGFCTVTIEGGKSAEVDVLLQRIHDMSRQREELQRMEIEMRAQIIAQSEILKVQSGYDLQVKKHADAAARLKDKLQERGQHIHELEQKLEEKDRELHAMKLDNEAAWAKEEATFRRERDNSETERAQCLQRILDLQKHIQEKEGQFLALEEQHRVAQETILYKDEQLRETQAWVARAQEMGALQSTTNQSLQAELLDRIEQFNQFYIGFQRQFMDMERHHLQAIQQLQLELAEARERNGAYAEGTQGAQEKLKESSSIGNKGNQMSSTGSGTSKGTSGFVSNGDLDGAASFVSSSNSSTKAEHVPTVPVISPSMLGLGGFLPHGQMASLLPYVMPAPQPLTSTSALIPQSQMSHIQPVSTFSAHQHWQNQQIPMENKNEIPQTEQDLFRSDVSYTYEVPTERQVVHPDLVNSGINQQQRSTHVMKGASEEVFESSDRVYRVSQESQETLSVKSQFHSTMGFDVPSLQSDLKNDKNTVSGINQPQEQSMIQGQAGSDAAVSVVHMNSVTSSNAADLNGHMARSDDEVPVLSARAASPLIPGKATEPTLLDEKSLLACIVRAIPAGSGSGVRISTTLPNRLAKMLAPLHWHDYKKHYGKLDDFVVQHPELFIIKGDFIHLREGAQEIISATRAVAEVAAAASSSTYSSFLPSISVTPVAQSSRHKKAPFTEDSSMMSSGDSIGKHLHISKMHNQQLYGVNYNIVKGISDINILSDSKDAQESDGLPSEMRPANPSVCLMVGNGAKLDRSGLTTSEIKSPSNGRHGMGGKRSGGMGSTSRR